jgi:hypothetical protein
MLKQQDDREKKLCKKLDSTLGLVATLKEKKSNSVGCTLIFHYRD